MRMGTTRLWSTFVRITQEIYFFLYLMVHFHCPTPIPIPIIVPIPIVCRSAPLGPIPMVIPMQITDTH